MYLLNFYSIEGPTCFTGSTPFYDYDVNVLFLLAERVWHSTHVMREDAAYANSELNESSSDQALMNKLAYWCSVYHFAMLQTFLKSPYYSQKDEAHKKKMPACRLSTEYSQARLRFPVLYRAGRSYALATTKTQAKEQFRTVIIVDEELF